MARAAETTADAIKRAIEECDDAILCAENQLDSARDAVAYLRSLITCEDGTPTFDPDAPDPMREKELLATWNRISTEGRGQKGATA